MVLHRIRSTLGAVLAVAALAACGDDGSGPPAEVVATVRVSPPTPSITVGDDVQLQATALTASGDTIDGKSFSWTTNAQTVATVAASTGLASGIAAGTAQITASVDGKSGSATLTVAPVGALPTLTAISPSPLQVGGGATLTGTGFTGSTQVFVNGVRGSVSAATATSLQITVPCVSPGQGEVEVRNAALASAPLAATVTAGAVSTPAIGELMLVSNPMCVQLASAGAQSYLIGVQSVSEAVSVLTPVTFGIEAGGATITSGGEMAAGLLRAPSVFGAVPPVAPQDETAARWRAHRSAEIALRARDRALMQPRFAAAQRFAQERNLAAYSTRISAAMAEVGDTLDLRYPDPEGNLCSDFAAVTGVVRHISAQAIFVADITNPANGYVMSDYVNFGNLLDNQILATEIDYFGEPTDHDLNGHVMVLFTREVNEREGILGMVSSTDFFPRTGPNSCVSSNEGEIYYGRAPDPTGSVGAAYSVEDARLDAPGLIAHEMTHIIQFGRRFDTLGAQVFQSLWELESQATLAEEVVGHDFNNLNVGQNYGFDVAWENCEPTATATAWYCDKFSDLALYYGFQNPPAPRAEGAPEQCTWVGRQEDTDPQPCVHQRLPYTGWSFLRWLSDHYGAQLGGEQELHKQMIANTTSGFATIENLIGEPIDELLAHWAATLYTDDRFAGMDALLTLPSWNLTAISNELVDNAQLAPYQRAFVDFATDVTVRGGSNAYFLVSGSRSASAVRATTQTGATLPSHMRIWIVRVQ